MKSLSSLLIIVFAVVVQETFIPEVFAQAPNHQSILDSVDTIQTQVNRLPPAWSEILPAATRFSLVLNNAAVLDKETGLVWERAPGDTNNSGFVDDTDKLNFSLAPTYCAQKTVGGRKGWRMPTVQELASLVDPTNSNPSLPIGHPFIGIQLFLYWTASASLIDAPYSVNFIDGNVTNGAGGDGTASTFIWCVRGGQG